MVTRSGSERQAGPIRSDRNSRGDMPYVARKSREKCEESSRPQRAAILLMGSPAWRGSSSSRAALGFEELLQVAR